VRAWDGPATFKSYLIFQQGEPLWQTEVVRQAMAYAVDREALAALFDGRRQPLYSPLPDSEPFAIPSAAQRDLPVPGAAAARRLYGKAPLIMTLWHLNDGRYTDLEDEYAQRLKEQLEATGMITVELQSAAWGTYSQQSSACEYSTFLLGWPPVGWPTRYPAAMGWLDFFVTGTDTLCSNYSSLEMDALIAEARQADPLDVAAQEEIYATYSGAVGGGVADPGSDAGDVQAVALEHHRRHPLSTGWACSTTKRWLRTPELSFVARAFSRCCRRSARRAAGPTFRSVPARTRRMFPRRDQVTMSKVTIAPTK
jgi:hypothetical protein